MADVPPAPVDQVGVTRALAPFGSSRMLPRAAYLDDSVLAWEREHLFGGWVCVGRADAVPASSMSGPPGGEGGLRRARAGDGRLHAFENAGRHRGHELMPCGGRAEDV